ncbi:hypothetical protein M3Y96_00672300 [Aphelenchoides besseyi]|nr:hypothetical protein M3Y96_00672300 [Aphelenchoides besseyi]
MLDLFSLIAFGQTIAIAAVCFGECTTVSKRARHNAAQQRQNMRKTQSSPASTTPSPGNQMNRQSTPNQEKKLLPKASKQEVKKVSTTGTNYPKEAKEKTEMESQLKNSPANPTINKQPLEKISNEKLPLPKSDKKTNVAAKVGPVKSDDGRKKVPTSLEEVTAISTKKKLRRVRYCANVNLRTAVPLADKSEIRIDEGEDETMALVKSLDDDPNPSRGEVRKQEKNDEPTPEL